MLTSAYLLHFHFNCVHVCFKNVVTEHTHCLALLHSLSLLLIRVCTDDKLCTGQEALHP